MDIPINFFETAFDLMERMGTFLNSLLTVLFSPLGDIYRSLIASSDLLEIQKVSLRIQLYALESLSTNLSIDVVNTPLAFFILGFGLVLCFLFFVVRTITDLFT